MTKIFSLIFIFLNIDIVYLDYCLDGACLSCGDEDDGRSNCYSCERGYHLSFGSCILNKCQEGEGLAACQFCSSNDRCSICSSGYEVYKGSYCIRSYLRCNSTDIRYCDKCEVVNGIETGNCGKCLSEFHLTQNKTCDGRKVLHLNKLIIYLILLIFLFIDY